jgi:trans-aconitate 2-methyltransferase
LSTWSARDYVSFEAERTRPVRDLVSGIPRERAATAVDLGCGPGNSTEVLAARFPSAAITGIDNAPDMIAAARKRLSGIAFDLAEIASWRAAAPVDVILSNAALQWVPDHDTLLPRLVSDLAPGGCLAIQMPDNLHEPVQVAMREVAAVGPWAARLAGAEAARTPIHDPAHYYRLLRPVCTRVDVWRTVYHHPLAGGVDGIVRWFESTGLKPFLDPLAEAERDEFRARYRAALAPVFPVATDGTVLLPFPRLFIVATRA